MSTIKAATITAMPKSFMDSMPRVLVTTEEQTEPNEFLFEYYPDEISFNPSEFLGLTIEEARSLKGKKDRQYLRS
jgi:hypothetical protein